MKAKLSEDLISISTMLMTAKSRGDMISLASELNAAVLKAMELETPTSYNDNKKTVSASIKFTKQEIDKMSKTFKKEFIANGCVGHVIKRPSGKKSSYYEIRYRRNGYNITVSHKDIKRAKELFIMATFNLESPETLAKKKLLFGTLADEWLEYKKNKVAYQTWMQYCHDAQKFIPDDLRLKSIKDIRTVDIERLMPLSTESPRQYEDARTLFNGIFTYAHACGIISHNPIALIPFKRAERKTRKRLTAEQVHNYLVRLENPKFDRIRQTAYVLYFFGLRPCEIDEETHFENGFLIARNRKRKNGKVNYKKIPIPKQAYQFIDLEKPIKPPLSYERWLVIIKDALGEDLTPYNLRHTFASICAENVKPEVVELWMGDSPERLVGKTYVHYSDEFMKEQMNTVGFIT